MAIARSNFLATIIGPLDAVAFGRLGQARKQELLIARAAGKGEIILLREINGRPDLDCQVCPAEGLIKFLPSQHAGAPRGALAQDLFSETGHVVVASVAHSELYDNLSDEGGATVSALCGMRRDFLLSKKSLAGTASGLPSTIAGQFYLSRHRPTPHEAVAEPGPYATGVGAADPADPITVDS